MSLEYTCSDFYLTLNRCLRLKAGCYPCVTYKCPLKTLPAFSRYIMVISTRVAHTQKNIDATPLHLQVSGISHHLIVVFITYLCQRPKRCWFIQLQIKNIIHTTWGMFGLILECF